MSVVVKMMYRFNSFLGFLFAFLLSCNKTTHDPTTELHNRYRLVEVTTDRPVDVNFDGEFNTDLTLEIPKLENILLVADRELSYINILWVEPQVNGGMLYRPLPSAYDASDDIQYQPVQNLIYYRQEGKIITLTTRAENDPSRHYTFAPSNKLNMDGSDGILWFNASQEFLTTGGVETFQLIVKYAPEKS